VSIGGSTVYNNSGGSLTQYAHTRWSIEGWIGSDPQVTPRHDTTYLIDSKLVPNYWKRNPGASALNGLVQSYSPMQQGNWPSNMGSGGYSSQIGLLPVWDALYLTSSGDARAYKSVLANANAINSYGIVWNDSVTKLPTAPSTRPNWTLEGANGGGDTAYDAGSLSWDVAHHGSSGYLAYMITGDYYYLETMENQAAMCYLMSTSSNYYDPDNGLGTERLFKGQTRGVAWCLRTAGELAGIGPSDTIVNDYRALLANNASHWNSRVQKPGQNPLGYLYSYEIGAYGPGAVAPWQQHFWVQTMGHVSDLEPFSNMSTWNSVRDHLYKSVVGILGPGGSGNYCFADAGKYTIVISPNSNADSTTWYDSWGDVYQSTVGSVGACGNAMTGTSGSDPSVSNGYWGNLLPAIAYAVDHGASGASAAWARLTGASNWSTFANSGFDNLPIWGIVPRTSSNPAPAPAPAPPPPPSDTAAPSVSITAPSSGSTVSGSAVNITATASDIVGVVGVLFMLD
jgi:hypothetical protein